MAPVPIIAGAWLGSLWLHDALYRMGEHEAALYIRSALFGVMAAEVLMRFIYIFIN